MQTINKIFINGAFVTPHGTQQENPATGEIITRVTLADEVDTKNAIRAANDAFRIIRNQAYKTAGNIYNEFTM